MVKFGQTIEDQRRPEWAEGYVNYKGLKKLLKAMDAAGTTREFSEHTVYKALSVASASNLLSPDAPREAEFFEAIDMEISKVNAFSDGLRQQLVAQFEAAQREHDALIGGANSSATADIAVRACTEMLQRFEDFINLNYLAVRCGPGAARRWRRLGRGWPGLHSRRLMALHGASPGLPRRTSRDAPPAARLPPLTTRLPPPVQFSKILKKHDKVSSCPCRAPYLLRIQRETFARQTLPELIKGISDLQASLAKQGAPAAAGPKHGAFDAAQKGGTSFTRSTRKYWCAPPRRARMPNAPCAHAERSLRACRTLPPTRGVVMHPSQGGDGRHPQSQDVSTDLPARIQVHRRRY